MVYNPTYDWVKIGMTRQYSKRMAMYRKENLGIEGMHRRYAGCWLKTSQREGKAIRKLAKTGENVRGDWFHGVTVEEAIEIVDAVCKGVKPR